MRKEQSTKRRVEGWAGGNMSQRCLSLESSYIPVATRRKVLERDHHRCVWCGEEEQHDVSHFIQKRSGGTTVLDDLVTTCKTCKRKRHYDTPADFIDRLKVEPIDFPNEVKAMRIKVIFARGEGVEGVVEDVPTPETKAFYLHSQGNGTRELIFTEPGMRIIEMGGEK